MTEAEHFNEKLSQFLQEFNGLKSTIDQLKKFKSLDELSEKISLIEYAKLNSSLAYTLNSLYYMYMKFNGISFEEHKINSEIERIQKYMQRIQEVIFYANEQKKNPLRIDIAATERMIRAQLADNNIMKNEDDYSHDPEKVIEIDQKESQSIIEELKNNGGIPIEQTTTTTSIIQVEEIKKPKEQEEIHVEIDEWATKQPHKPQKTKKLHKGSLLPSGGHINWKDQIEKMMK